MKRLAFFLLFYIVAVDTVYPQNPNTAKFPGAVATDQDLFVAKNVARPSVTLTAPVDNVTVTLPVTDGTKFRQYQIVGVDLELMQVCTTGALSLTVCGRGLGGTTAASHSTGAVIGFPFADVQVNQAAAEIKAIESAIINGPLLVARTTDDGSGAKLQVSGGIATSRSSDNRQWTMNNASGALRWGVGITAAETGGNAGSDLVFWRYADGGANIGAPVIIKRATSNVLIGQPTDNGTDILQVNGSVGVQSNGGLSLKNSDGISALSITTTNNASNRNTSINMTGGVNALTSNASILFLGAVNASWGLTLGSTGHSFTGNVGVGKTPATALDVSGSAAISGTVDSGGLARDTVPALMQTYYAGERIYTDGNIRGITISKTDPAADSYWYNAGNLDVINVNMGSSVTADKWASVYGTWQYMQTDPTSTGEFSGELWGRALETHSGANAGGFLPSTVGGTWETTKVGNGALNSIWGYSGEAAKEGSGQADFITGAHFAAGLYGSASSVVMKALDLQTLVRQTATATNAYGLYINPLYKEGTPTITNAYGMYVGDWSGTGGTDSYNILSVGSTSKNKFEGDVRAGTFSVSKNNSLDRTFFSAKVNDTDRWNIGLHGSEFGSNGGSGLSFWSYADNGAYLGAPLQLRRTGAVLLNTDTDDGVNKLQVAGGGIWSDKAFSSGTGTAKGRFGAVADNLPRADFAFNTSFSSPNWNRDDIAKSASLFAMWDGHADMYVAPSGANPISWVTGFTILPTGEVNIPKRHQQINFTFYDPNVAMAAATIPGLWRAEYGAATITKVSCMADTGDAVIQIKKNTSTNVLTANLTCGNGSWTNTTAFAAAAFATGDDLGLQIISGTAKRISVSSQYTGN